MQPLWGTVFTSRISVAGVNLSLQPNYGIRFAILYQLCPEVSPGTYSGFLRLARFVQLLKMSASHGATWFGVPFLQRLIILIRQNDRAVLTYALFNTH